MSDDVNKSLQVAMADKGIQPVSPGGPQTGPLTPSGAPTQKPVEGLPDIKDKTAQPPAQQQPQQQAPAPPQEGGNGTVPLAVLQEERQKRQDLERTVKAVNDQNSELHNQVATLNGQMQNLAAMMQQGQHVQQQEQVPEQVPDIMLEPNEWTNWMLGQVDNLVAQRVMGIAEDAFKQRMQYFNQKAIEKYGSDVVAKATNWMVQQGRRNEAVAHFDPTEYSVLQWYQQQGINHFAADHTGRLDPKAYNERFTGQLLQAPQFWDQIASNPQYQQAYAQAFQRMQQQAPQGQQPQAPQQPQQGQQVVYPQQFQQPQQQPQLPPSMIGQPGAGIDNGTPLPSVIDDLQSALDFGNKRAVNGRA